MYKFGGAAGSGKKEKLRSRALEKGTVDMGPSYSAKVANLFKYREQQQERTEHYPGPETVKKSRDMWKYHVRNQFEYQVLKIQKWWRRRAFLQVLEEATERQAKKTEAGKRRGEEATGQLSEAGDSPGYQAWLSTARRKQERMA